MVEQDGDHGDGGDQNEDQVLPIWKRRKRKIKWAQGKGKMIGPFCFATQDT